MSRPVTITVEILQWGQPKAYAPHTYEARITTEGRSLMEREMRDIVRGTVYPFKDEDETTRKDTMDYHFSTKLKALEQESSEYIGGDEDRPTGLRAKREVWYARVETPYTD